MVNADVGNSGKGKGKGKGKGSQGERRKSRSPEKERFVPFKGLRETVDKKLEYRLANGLCVWCGSDRHKGQNCPHQAKSDSTGSDSHSSSFSSQSSSDRTRPKAKPKPRPKKPRN